MAITHTTNGNIQIYIVDNTSDTTFKIPESVGNGQIIMIKNINTGTVTVTPNGSDTIDTSSTKTLKQWEDIQIVDYSDGLWVVIAKTSIYVLGSSATNDYIEINSSSHTATLKLNGATIWSYP